MLNVKHMRRRYERAAGTFDDADFVHAASREGLLARLQPLLVDATTVIDLGSATGAAHRQLHKRFPKARIIAVDIAHDMLLRARKRKSWLAKTAFVQADGCALPFADESVDVIFSNQLLPNVPNLDALFQEVARVLRKGGVFAFASLGPDSLLELRDAWHQIDKGAHVSPFPDMHNLGDGLVNAGLRDPVLDVDRLALSYSSGKSLIADLSAVGARNVLAERFTALTGKARFRAMLGALEAQAKDGKIMLELELVFGHCWGAGPKMDPANYRIDAGRIPIRNNR